MKKIWHQFRYLLEYALVVGIYAFIRLLPHFCVKGCARFFGFCMYCWPDVRRVSRANVKTAFPEMETREACRIARASLFHLVYNLLEFIWMSGIPKRIERCTCLPPDVTDRLKEHVARGERIIFVNPHLGSWEASGVMAPYYAGVRMVAIAKPIRNPYLNTFFNRGHREKASGLHVIFSKGAIKAAIHALKDGLGVGTLIDQNTRVRDGGIFVNFFGLPVPSSKGPAGLLRYCRMNQIPAVIVYGTSVRLANDVVTAHAQWLSKPFEEYADDAEIIQELMNISCEYIRKYPEQYLWFYRRFQYIPREGVTPEQVARYPYYARPAAESFYWKVRN